MVKEKFPNSISADPSKFSFREEEIKLSPSGGNFFVDKSTGEKFYQLDNQKAPKIQKLAAMILKGVINVSDVVKIGNYYYSHVQDLGKVEESKNNILAQAQADRLIIEAVISDEDHSHPINQAKDSPDVAHNLKIDKVGKKLNFFDFSESGLKSMYEEDEDRDLVKMAHRMSLDLQTFNLFANRRSVLKIIKAKTVLLSELYQDSNFTNLQAMVEKSGIKLNEEQERRMFRNIQTRIGVLLELVTEELNQGE